MKDFPFSSSSEEVAQLALGLSLREILIYLPVRDLLSCSLVNKHWNYEARAILRDRKNCIVSIQGSHPCVALLNLNNLLAQMSVVPFNGLRVSVDQRDRGLTGCCVGIRNIERHFSFMLNEWPLKYLEIISLDKPTTKCPVDEIMGRLVVRKSGTLEQLLFSAVPRELKSIEVNTELKLSNLKLLHLSPDVSEPLALHLFANIELIAPKLEEIRGDMNIEDMKVLPPSKYFLVKELLLHCYPQNEPESPVLDMSAMGTVTLESLNVNISIHHDLPDCWELVRILLEGSKVSLKCLRIGACSLLNLIRTGNVSSLENVETLQLGLLPYWFEQASQSQIQTLAQELPLSTLFPKLKTVNLIDDHPHGFYTECYCCMNGCQGEADPVATNSVFRLCDSYYLLSSLTFPYVSRMFPQILDFESANAYPDPLNSYMHIWSSWPELKCVTLTFECGPRDNLDGLFCGISEEEARFLQKSTPEYLERVIIVPIKPPVYSFRDLEQLSLRLIIHEDNGIGEYSDLFFLSKVSGYLAFRRMSGQINVSCFRNFGALSHLVPFVNVNYTIA